MMKKGAGGVGFCLSGSLLWKSNFMFYFKFKSNDDSLLIKITILGGAHLKNWKFENSLFSSKIVKNFSNF